MKRTCFGLRLYPGTETEYDRRHADIWPELKAAIREAGIRNLSAFRRGTDVWHYAECDPDGATAFAKLGATNVNAKWDESLRPIVATDGERIWFQEIFHANGGGAGPFERGLFTLVVHPDRIAGEDPPPPEPRPGKMRGGDEGGVHNYTRLPPGAPGVYHSEVPTHTAGGPRAQRATGQKHPP